MGISLPIRRTRELLGGVISIAFPFMIIVFLENDSDKRRFLFDDDGALWNRSTNIPFLGFFFQNEPEKALRVVEECSEGPSGFC